MYQYHETTCIPDYDYTTIGLKSHMVRWLPQPLRFFGLFFTTLLVTPCGGDVAVVTADRPSPVLARAGTLGVFAQAVKDHIQCSPA
jgi:hypothetical protein